VTILIKNCRLVEKKGATHLFIKNGKIAEIGVEKRATKTIDAKGKYLLPGLIDAHVHFREPGGEHKETIRTGSKAAAAGGVTTVLDMPNTKPPTATLKDYKKKLKLGKKSVINYIPYFLGEAENLKELKKLPKEIPVKVFLDVTTGHNILTDKNRLLNIFKTRKLTAVHAEGENLKFASELIKLTKNKLYLCHVSSEEEIEFLKKHKTKQIYVEVTPHHLFLNSDDVKDAFGVCLPLIKSELNRQTLWQALREGLVDTICTDHAPHTKQEKKSKNPPFGLPGVETRLPLLLNAVSKKKLTLKQVVELCCHNPAKIFGLKNKGFIKKGYDADLVMVDMKLKKKVENKNLYTKCKWSPFTGWQLRGWPVMTIYGGKIIFKN